MKSYKFSHSFLVVFVILCLSFCSFTFANFPPPDLDGDGWVDFADFSMLASKWFLTDCNDFNGWCGGADMNQDGIVNFSDFSVLSKNWLYDDSKPYITWIYIDDSGVREHEGFTGYMSKYETTNAQYCQFLNSALSTGDIFVSNSKVYGDNGLNSGTDFVGYIYLKTFEADTDSQIIYSEGEFSVRSRDGYDMSNHPVVGVSWYGATGFANYYDWRLPTEWQWESVADYDGSYRYGCGMTIDQSKANYWRNEYANPLGLSSPPYTTPVGYYPAYGYGICDMAGNAWEWTSSCYYYDCADDFHVIRGGGWYHDTHDCQVYLRNYLNQNDMGNCNGFRVCRDNLMRTIVPNVVSMSQEEAEEAIVDARLAVGTVSEEYSEIVEAGHVISQSPADGDNLLMGTTVDLVVSLGSHPDPDITWVYIDDPGVGEHEGFTGDMSKYETTNAQYCQFLNSSLATGDIYVSDGKVYGANGLNSGADFEGDIYFRIYTSSTSSYSQITYSNGIFSVRTRNEYDMSNHPVVGVSWYGATAFANYYDWRLPTEWEWQAVADYDGSYTYGCGTTLDRSKANYRYPNPLGLSYSPYTTPVGYYPAYGYGICDMAGNVCEWTSSLYPSGSNNFTIRGGSWNSYFDFFCEVSRRDGFWVIDVGFTNGFRVCR